MRSGRGYRISTCLLVAIALTGCRSHRHRYYDAGSNNTQTQPTQYTGGGGGGGTSFTKTVNRIENTAANDSFIQECALNEALRHLDGRQIVSPDGLKPS